MTYLIDDLVKTNKQIDGKWVIARPLLSYDLLNRIVDCWLVLIGKADAVIYISGKKNK